MVLQFVLFESALGFGLFERVKADEIGLTAKDVQASISDLERFSKMVKMKGAFPSCVLQLALRLHQLHMSLPFFHTSRPLISPLPLSRPPS